MDEEKFIRSFRDVVECPRETAQSAYIIWDAVHPPLDVGDGLGYEAIPSRGWTSLLNAVSGRGDAIARPAM